MTVASTLSSSLSLKLNAYDDDGDAGDDAPFSFKIDMGIFFPAAIQDIYGPLFWSSNRHRHRHHRHRFRYASRMGKTLRNIAQDMPAVF